MGKGISLLCVMFHSFFQCITEYHSTRRGVFYGKDLCFDGLSEEVSTTVDYNHCTIIEVSNTLSRLFSDPLYFDGDVFSGILEWLECVGK